MRLLISYGVALALLRTMMTKQYERFKVKRKVPFAVTLLWGLESVIYILGGFFAGFQLRASNNLLYLLLLFFIIVLRFKWQTIEEITKKVRLI
jgi:hypothetical protein